MSGIQDIKVVADLDTRLYSIEVGGTTLISDVPFRNADAVIGEIRVQRSIALLSFNIKVLFSWIRIDLYFVIF